MIGYVQGTISHLLLDYCLVNVQGVGYRVYISEQTRGGLQIGQPALLFTHLTVREDAHLLYGFLSQEEHDLFLRLINLNGVGSKLALAILSALKPISFYQVIARKDIAALTKISGVGKKTAERLLLELKDIAAPATESDGEDSREWTGRPGEGDVEQECIAALLALGYNQAEISPLVRRLSPQYRDVENLIRQALREMGRR